MDVVGRGVTGVIHCLVRRVGGIAFFEHLANHTFISLRWVSDKDLLRHNMSKTPVAED
jgi:hypothetical protein